MKNEKNRWGRRAPFCLIKDLNCALATMECMQDLTGNPDPDLLKAVTGLEGGLVASGSTCGVVTAGALGIALMHIDDLNSFGTEAEKQVFSRVDDYLKWFKDTYGSFLCRDRTRVDFYKALGQLRYLLPGDRVVRCMWHIRGALRHLYDRSREEAPALNASAVTASSNPVHCATQVLRGIRERTGVGNERLETISFVFDGGVALHGGICGALAGGIMGVNLVLGQNVRSESYFKTIGAFFTGHVNLLVNTEGKKPEPFSVGRQMVENFRQTAGGIECREIIGRTFSGWDDFQAFMPCSDHCAGLIARAADDAAEVIRKLSRE